MSIEQLGVLMAFPRGVVLENPFYVTPKGTAQYVTPERDTEYRSEGKIPRAIEREGIIEQFSGLPEGYSVVESNRQFHIYFQGQDTGKFALDYRKACEIAHRMQGGKVTVRAPRKADVAAGPRRAAPVAAPAAPALKVYSNKEGTKFYLVNDSREVVAGPFSSKEEAQAAAARTNVGRRTLRVAPRTASTGGASSGSGSLICPTTANSMQDIYEYAQKLGEEVYACLQDDGMLSRASVTQNRLACEAAFREGMASGMTGKTPAAYDAQHMSAKVGERRTWASKHLDAFQSMPNPRSLKNCW